MKIQNTFLFSIALTLSSLTFADESVEHSHAGRVHSHPLPVEGLSHNHNGGGNSTPEVSSSWIKITTNEAKTYFVKNHSQKIVNGRLYIIGKTHEKLSKSIEFYRLSISLEHCRNEVGQMRWEGLNGEHRFNSDFVFDGGTTGSFLAEMVCLSAKYI